MSRGNLGFVDEVGIVGPFPDHVDRIQRLTELNLERVPIGNTVASLVQRLVGDLDVCEQFGDGYGWTFQ